MNWGSVGNFFQMGGYAWFVWGAYGVTAVLVAAELIALRNRRRTAVTAVQRRARSGAAHGAED